MCVVVQHPSQSSGSLRPFEPGCVTRAHIPDREFSKVSYGSFLFFWKSPAEKRVRNECRDELTRFHPRRVAYCAIRCRYTYGSNDGDVVPSEVSGPLWFLHAHRRYYLEFKDVRQKETCSLWGARFDTTMKLVIPH